MNDEELLNRPVEYMVIFETLAHKEVSEEFAKIHVVRPLVKIQITDILEIGCKFLWELAAKVLSRDVYLLLFNPLVSLVLRSRLQALPGQRAASKVNHHLFK
jgi:hypothetical protein